MYWRGGILGDKIHIRFGGNPGVISNKTDQRVVLLLQEKSFLSHLKNFRDGF